MSVQGPEPNTSTQTESKRLHLESVEKISNLPVISTGINFTSDLYAKVKNSNAAIGFLLGSAEHTVSKASQLVEPVANTLESPIKLADSVLCSTIDFVGSTIPKVVETPQKVYSKAISSVPVQPAVDCVKSVGNYGAQKVNHLFQSKCDSEPQSATDDENDKETEPGNRDGAILVVEYVPLPRQVIQVFRMKLGCWFESYNQALRNTIKNAYVQISESLS